MPTRKAAPLRPAPAPAASVLDPKHTAIFVVVVTGLNQQPGGSPPVIRPVRLDDDLLGKVLAVAQQQLMLRPGFDGPSQIDPPRPLQGLAAVGLSPPFTAVAAPGVTLPALRPRAARKSTATPPKGSPEKGKLKR